MLKLSQGCVCQWNARKKKLRLVCIISVSNTLLFMTILNKLKQMDWLSHVE